MTIPTHLTKLMTGALETGAAIRVEPGSIDGRDWLFLEITWTDGSATLHAWSLGPDDVWTHKGPGRITDTRARIKRETS